MGLTEQDAAHLTRAIQLAERGRGTAHPNPIVGAVVLDAAGEVVAEGYHERPSGPHGEAAALAEAGERARGGTLYVTLEPCSHERATREACAEVVVRSGVARVVAGQVDPNPRVNGAGLARLEAAGVRVELADGDLGFRCREQLAGFRRAVADGRPFVTYKVAVSLDGRVVVPGARWVTGKESRRLVHELRAASDAVAVGAGTARSDRPRLDARDVCAVRQPRRLVFARRAVPEGLTLEPRRGEPAGELRALAAEGVQTLLLEGGPTLATAFLEADLVDRLLVFVAPVLSGNGPHLLGDLVRPRPLTRLTSVPVGDDVLVSAYVHEP